MKVFGIRILRFISNPFLIITLLFVILMIFFDSNSYLQLKKRRQQIQSLNEEKEFYRQEILELGEELESIDKDPEQLEKFAREKYFMKRDNEDVFIIGSEEN